MNSILQTVWQKRGLYMAFWLAFFIVGAVMAWPDSVEAWLFKAFVATFLALGATYLSDDVRNRKEAELRKEIGKD